MMMSATERTIPPYGQQALGGCVPTPGEKGEKGGKYLT
jgi:hypothetical protein